MRAPDASVSEILQAALSYAERGWCVFPCHPATKRPVVEHGLHAATRDEQTIREWWTQWPGAMIGCRTGPESGVWALDLDLDSSRNGISNFSDLCTDKEPIPETLATQTPRGGRHLFFAWTDGIKNSTGKLAHGVDVRGAGGYCILPPSMRSDGRRYERLFDIYPDLPAAPKWLLELVVDKTAPAPDATLAVFTAAAARHRTGGNGNSAAYGAAALENECRAVTSAPPGTRNHALNRAAFSLGQLVAGGVLSEGGVRLHLRDAANACGLVKDDGAAAVLATLNSGLGAGMKQPRPMPERTASLPPSPALSSAAAPAPSIEPWHYHDDAPTAPTLWLVKSVLPQIGAGLVSGQWGTYKTTVALDVSVSIMSGVPFGGRCAVRRQGGVIYIAAEGAGGLKSRLDAAARERGVIGILPFAWRSDCPALTAPDALDRLTRLVEEAGKQLRERFDVPLALIWIDTIIAAAGYAKTGDDNDQAAAQKIMSVLSRLSQRTSALALGVDHFGKITDTGTRGSSAKEGHADVVLALLADREINGTVSNTRLAIRKLREGEAGLELSFTVKTVQIGADQDGDPITRVVLDWSTPQTTAADAKDWSKSLRLLRRILMTTLVNGVDVTPFADGPTVRAVDLELVRAEFNKQYVAEGTDRKKADTRRHAFNRAIKDAQNKALIATREVAGVQLVWLVRPETQEET
jgi:Bifunctional DNA primase/polymerase, N-terminal/AAA domain